MRAESPPRFDMEEEEEEERSDATIGGETCLCLEPKNLYIKLMVVNTPHASANMSGLEPSAPGLVVQYLIYVMGLSSTPQPRSQLADSRHSVYDRLLVSRQFQSHLFLTHYAIASNSDKAG